MENKLSLNSAIFVSDLHITSPSDDKAKQFLKLLKKIENLDVKQLVLLGDIFDLWVANHSFFKESYLDICKQIQYLVKLGIEVHYFEGNHDLYLSDYWQKELGLQVHSDFLEVNWYNKKIRMEHGDLSNPEDKGYLFLRSFLRNSLVRYSLSNLPARWIKCIGEKASEKSRDYTSNINIDAKNVLREYSKKIAETSDYDLMITGHTHCKDDFSFMAQNKTRQLINLGSWFDTFEVLKLSENHLSFVNIDEL